MNELQKRVSIVMCTYNGERFLREQIDSLLNQTYPLYEIIIQDDSSTDGTRRVVQEYADKYDTIKPCINKAERGVNANFFSAMHLATGDYIAICDQDDIWEKNK
ncbi:MAG TPA: glycosyltransferase, partial [Candidatus Parabacteroides intestinavium]|nr:glycosyltransferase [Candidatus Parabacteroides intestinavium]